MRFPNKWSQILFYMVAFGLGYYVFGLLEKIF